MSRELQKEAIDGAKARQVLENEAYQTAWEDAENSIIAQMVEVPMRDTEMHSRLVMALQILASVRKHINTVLETGQMAEMSLREDNSVTRMFKR